jgi:hypothetical protein
MGGDKQDWTTIWASTLYMTLMRICHALQLMMKTQVLIWSQRQVDAQCLIRVIPDGKLMRQSEKDLVQTPTKKYYSVFARRKVTAVGMNLSQRKFVRKTMTMMTSLFNFYGQE